MEHTVAIQNQRQFQLILDDFCRKFPYKSKRSTTYLRNINEALAQLEAISPSLLANTTAHRFYSLLRDLTSDLLIKWNSSYTLNPDEQYLLRNCVLLISRLVDSTKDVTALLGWLLHPSFTQAIAYCLSNIDQILLRDPDKKNFKQLTRLLDLFARYIIRLPINLQNDPGFNPLFEATMDCLTSSSYNEIFRRLTPYAKSMRSKEKFFLVQCPSFLSSKRGHSDTIIEQLLETMVPRYASILNQYIGSITEWNSAIMQAVYHLLLTVTIAKGHYTSYAYGQPLQWLIDHVVSIINQPTMIKKINANSTACDASLIGSALKVLLTFVRDPDLLIYIKQLKILPIIRSLIFSPCESITFYIYTILSYIMGEDDIKASEKESGRLLSNIFDSFRRQIKLFSEMHQNEQRIAHNIGLLVEAIQVLVQHDQIKSEILKQNALPLLINNMQRINEKSQRLILESLGSMTFDAEAARLLRENTQFINSVRQIQDTHNDGIRKAAEKIIWNLIREPEKIAERKEKKEEKNKSNDKNKEEKSKKEEYEYDIMISYCHADKLLVHKIHRFLADQGFKIWIDREQIYGPAMQAMAEAIEKSEFVILCMSDSYKRSGYCQAEAEYAFQCKRRLIPLIVRQAYRPDGWLGLLLGSRIYIDFGKFDFKTSCESLLNEMTLQRKSQVHVKKDNEQITTDAHVTGSEKEVPSKDSHKIHLSKEYTKRNTSDSTYHSTPLEQWTNKDILDFLADVKLYSMMPLCESLSGRGLKRLFQMCLRRPTKVYSQLTEELHSRFDELLPLATFTQFLTEVDQIIQPIEYIQPIKRPSKSFPLSLTNTVKSDTTKSAPTPLSSSMNSIKGETTTLSTSKSSVKDDTNRSTRKSSRKIRSS